MSNRIKWVPSLLTGELVPKKRSVWDMVDDEENEEQQTNYGRLPSLMESTPYTRPKNYEVTDFSAVMPDGGGKVGYKKPEQAPAAGNGWVSRRFERMGALPGSFDRIMEDRQNKVTGLIADRPVATGQSAAAPPPSNASAADNGWVSRRFPLPSITAPFDKMIENNRNGIYQPQPKKVVQPPTPKIVLAKTDPYAPRDSISDLTFGETIRPYLDPNRMGLSADSLRTISQANKDVEYGLATRHYNPSGGITSSEIKADYITHGKPGYEKDGFLYHKWDADLKHRPGTETTGFLHTHPGTRSSSPSPGDMWVFAESQKDRKDTRNSLMAAFTPNTEYYITIENQEKMKEAIHEKVFDDADRDFHIDESRNVSQERNFMQRYMKNDQLRGVFGVYRRCYRNGKLDEFEKAVLDEKGECSWKPIKGQDAFFTETGKK